MYVHLPWKGLYAPLRSLQYESLERNAKGQLVLPVRNPDTNRINKCRVYETDPHKRTSPSPSSPSSPSKKRRKKRTSSPRTSSPNSITRLEDLIGRRVHGVIARTGPDYVALLVDRIDGLDGSSLSHVLVSLAKDYVNRKHVPWHVRTPRSWSIPIESTTRPLGPHVSLHEQHMDEVGSRASLRVEGVMHWEKNHRWVALRLQGPLVDHTEWHLHLSCAQEVLS